tara:strand:- start:345 stop:548 length:204 start_codon:yes stop_codon:yes gene_type:complete
MAKSKVMTKEWEFTSLRLPKGLLKLLRLDAKENMRPIGLHLAYILDKHINDIYVQNDKGYYIKRGDK